MKALICAVVVGCMSNGYSKEQLLKIKELLAKPKSNTNELVREEIKKTLKLDNEKKYNKDEFFETDNFIIEDGKVVNRITIQPIIQYDD